MNARSWLFVPGDAPQKIIKADASGADALIFDLEDSVSHANKPKARALVAARLNEPAAALHLQYWVRVNPLNSGMLLDDLAAVICPMLTGIIFPKCESAHEFIKLSNYLDAFEASKNIIQGGVKILPITTETPAAIFNLSGYAQAGPRLAGLTWGAEDLSAAVGAATNRMGNSDYTDICRLARALCLAGAASAGVAAIETVYPDFRNLEGLRAYANAGRREGFTAMLAIHPAQISIINEVMTPSKAEIAHAQNIISLFAAKPEAGVIAFDGQMLDLPHLKQAKRILSMAKVHNHD